jgi:hypothetical protein
MVFARVFAAALLTAAACAAGRTAEGEWSCPNESETGSKGKWTLAIREDGAKLAGKLTDGEIEIPLVDVKQDGSRLTFGFLVNGRPYTFEGKADATEIAGKYAGEEARGSLSCQKPGR